MVTTSGRVVFLGFLFLVGVLWIGVGRSVAADAPEKLPPTPPQSASLPKSPAEDQSQAAAVNDESEAVDSNGSADFGLAICGPPGRFWLRADYLSWWTSGMDLPALVTNGVVGSSGTTTLFGDDTVNNDGRSGYHTTIGGWLGVCRIWGVEFDYLNLGQKSTDFSRMSTGWPVLARPFFNVSSNRQAVDYVAYPNTNSGTISADAADYFQSAGFLLSYNLCSSDLCDGGCDSCGDSCGDSCQAAPARPLLFCCRADLLVGFRYYNLWDRVGVHDVGRDITSSMSWDRTDEFNADNSFYGSEIGLHSRAYRGRWSFDVLTKVAVGNNHRTVRIQGQTTTVTAQSSIQYPYGLLAYATNSGTHQADSLAAIPQLGVEVGYQLNRQWRTYVGYNVIYWGAVSRAADQIDLNLDARSGGIFPTYPNKTASFWAQGVNAGLERRF